MRRWMILGSIAIVLLFSLLLSPAAKAGVLQGQYTGGPFISPTGTKSSIDLQHLKDQVRQTFGQQAVDQMHQRFTHSLKAAAWRQPLIALPQTMATTPLREKANASAPEQYGTSLQIAGYVTSAQGVSWVQGCVGSFNVPTAGGVVPVTTGIIVGDTGQNAKISLGVVKDGARSNASVSFVNGETLDLFPVNASDQMDAEIYLDSNSNQWLIFIEDENTATYYANEFSYTTIITYAGWLASVNDSPLPAMNPILFTNARWFSNWADWQPIPSSAAAYYIQWTLDKSPGLIQTTILIGSPPGTSFYLATCATCP